MLERQIHRRAVLARAAGAAGAVLWSGVARAAEKPSPGRLHVAINAWSVSTLGGRDKARAGMPMEAQLAELAACGIDGLEPSAASPEQIDSAASQLARHGLAMRSVYSGSSLHDPAKAEQSIRQIVAVAQAAKKAGARIVVTNPSPLPGRAAKTDQQLITQAASLDRLGSELRSLGLVLAYHNHDVELQNAAREFHHMMLGTDPRHLALCLDAHWVYRGAGHSQVALFDVLKLYGPRVVELHVRQSRENVWSEALEDGDIDYQALAKALLDLGVAPHVVLEQGPEAGTPQTMSVAEIHRRSSQYARRVFAGFARPGGNP